MRVVHCMTHYSALEYFKALQVALLAVQLSYMPGQRFACSLLETRS